MTRSPEPGSGFSAIRGKAEWRAELLAARRAVDAAERAREAALLAGLVPGLVRELFPGVPSERTICGYVPFGAEPGSLAMLDALVATGYEVLLPITPPDRDSSGGHAALDWGRYHGPESLASSRLGFRQPSGQRLGPEAIARADVVLVPALAVDHNGVRLGRGGGWYDRSLPLVRPGARLVAVVRDDEVVDELPAEPHDVRMTGVLTPRGGFRSFPLG